MSGTINRPWATHAVRRCIAICAGAAILAVAWAAPAAAESTRERALEKRVEQLEKKLGSMEKLLLEVRASLKATQAAKAPARTARAAPAQPAPAQKVVKSGKSGVELTISGHVNRAVQVADDGRETNVNHVDNDNSSTRLKVHGVARVDDELSFGAQMEVEFESNSSSVSSQLNENSGTNSFMQRKLEVYAKTRRFGNLWLGQGDMAANGTSEVDLSATKVVTGSDAEDYAGGLRFVRKDVAPGAPRLVNTDATNPNIADSFDNLDGAGRQDRARYDTPKVMGFQVSTSHAATDIVDVAARYSGKLGPVKLKSAFGFTREPESKGDGRTAGLNRVNGSVSALHVPTGLSLTYASGADFAHGVGSADALFWYVKAGWQYQIFSFGKSAFAVDYGEYIDQFTAGDFGQSYGVYVVQKIDKAATEIYAGLRNHTYDQKGTNFEDLLAALIGARVKF